MDKLRNVLFVFSDIPTDVTAALSSMKKSDEKCESNFFFFFFETIFF